MGSFCMSVSNAEFLRRLEHITETVREAQTKYVEVGITQDAATANIYENGDNVAQVAARHEYGYGVPLRSFLRVPFEIKNREIEDMMQRLMTAALDGRTNIDQALGLLGTEMVNISKGAFDNNGYGTWTPLDPQTIEDKGSSRVLIDTGTLRRAITYRIGEEQ